MHALTTRLILTPVNVSRRHFCRAARNCVAVKSAPLSTQTRQTPSSPLQILAARIASHADALSSAADALSHPQRSLSPSSENPSRLLPANAPASARAEQVALRDALAEAQLLATDASEFVPDLAVRNNQFASVRWLCHFNIPQVLPLDDAKPKETHYDATGTEKANTTPPASFPTQSYAAVAKSAGVPEHHLRRIARMAMLMGFLAEPKPGRLSHSSLSAAMAKEPRLLEWARFVTSSSAPMVTTMVEATERWGGDPAINHTPYNVAWDTDLSIFAHVAAEPSRQARWAAYMRVLTQSQGMTLGHLVEGWRDGWEALVARGGVLVDVGGSAGHGSAALARAFPGLKAVVQDRVEVVKRAQNETAPELDKEGLQLKFQAHDFFEPQPERPTGWQDQGKGDVYLLRQILHDWGDEQAIVILRHMTTALKQSGPNSRLIVMDTVLPSPGEGSRTEEGLLRVRDLTMLQAHNAHERSRAQWDDLLARAEPGLKIKHVVQPFKSLMAVIEIGLEVGEQ